MRLGLTVLEVGLRAPLRPSGSPASARPLVLVRLEAAAGTAGHGESAPLEGYDGVRVERVLEALRTYEPVLAGADADSHSEVLDECEALDPLPQAIAAVDLALWNLAGRRAGKPVVELLGEPDPQPVAVNATIGAVEPRAAAQEAAAAVSAGFTCVKVKVGTPDDRQRLTAIRDAVGPDLQIRVDANGAWTRLDAPERIRALSRFDIELFEEPVHGQADVQAVAGKVPKSLLALDESASRDSGTFAHRYCDAVCLKISSSGGITGVLRDARTARAVGYEVYIASTLDGPLGIAAALHAAAVVKPDRHCGLATLDRFDRPNPLPAAGGHMRVPAGPGLGDGLLPWYDAQ